MSPVAEEYQRQAADWINAGRSPALLITGTWDLMALLCWIGSQGSEREEVTSQITEFAKASSDAWDAKSPGWYGRLMAEREYCDSCGERYRTENLSLCTKCRASYCYRCVGHYAARAPNGNRAHACGGELVG